MKRKIVDNLNDSDNSYNDLKRIKKNVNAENLSESKIKNEEYIEKNTKVEVSSENLTHKEDSLKDDLIDDVQNNENEIKAEILQSEEKSDEIKLIESIENPEKFSKSEIKKKIKTVIKYINNLECEQSTYLNCENVTLDKLLDFLIKMMESKRKRRSSILIKINLYKLLSVYGGSLSNKDQKIKYILLQSELEGKEFYHNIFGVWVDRYIDYSDNTECQIRPDLEFKDIIRMICFDRIIKTCYKFPKIYELPYSSEKFSLMPEGSDKYDPYYLMTWILENFFEASENSTLKLSEIVTDVGQFIKYKLVHFLISCHTCQRVKSIRVLANQMLTVIITKLRETFPKKEDIAKVKMSDDYSLFNLSREIIILEHAGKTLSHYKLTNEKVPRVIINFYLKMLKMASKKETPVFKKLYDMMRRCKDGFKSFTLPLMKLVFHNTDLDASSLFAWVINLICNSVKDRVDFQIMHSTSVFTDILEELHVTDLPLQVVILGLVKSCVANDKVLKTLLKKYNFAEIMGLLSVKFKDSKDVYTHLESVANQIVETVENSDMLKSCLSTKKYCDYIKLLFKKDAAAEEEAASVT